MVAVRDDVVAKIKESGLEEDPGLKMVLLREGLIPPRLRWPSLAREAAAEHPYKASTPQPALSPTDALGTDALGTDAPDVAVPDVPVFEDPDDELFLLGERCAEAYLQSDALQYRAMTLLADFHHRDGWRDTGFSSTAEWLAWRIGIKPNAARERLRTALALEQLPETSLAMRDGELSFTKVRTLTRVATRENEGTLLEFARSGSAANLERVVRGWKTLDRKSELTAEQIRHRRRRFSAWVDDDGSVLVRGRLDPEVGAVLMRAVEAASDALFRKDDAGEDGEDVTAVTSVVPDADAELDEVTPEQRRADALGLMAERALAAGFDAPISGSRAERYQVMLHVDAETLKEDGEVGRSELEDGTRVTAVTSRRVACDAGLVEVARGPEGQVVGAGKRKRTVPPALRRALEARDRGCRFPGCGLRFTDAHHVKHWADGGETTLGNLVLLCRRHHRAVHEGGVSVCMDVNQQVVFFTPKGKALLAAPPVDVSASIPRWKHDSDIPWEVEARAWEALDSG